LEERVRFSKRRQTIAKRLVEAQQTAAMLTTFNEVDMTSIMDLRRRRKDEFLERHGVRLGFMSFFVKAVVGALKAFPQVNSELQGDELVLKKYYDIGVAVSTGEGLVVPVVREADKKSFAEVEADVAELARRGRDGKLKLQDLQGRTFTITNGGVFGNLMSTPILNTPQVGILGMHRVQERPMVVEGEIVARPMMYLALSYDHRVIDGAEAVSFLARVRDLIQDPESLLLEG
jgi:2-oxoglutarate dehydrogenase E2 component (dihydrolipoamide succinyltransferase)